MRHIAENVLSQDAELVGTESPIVLNVALHLNLEKLIFELYSLALFHVDAYRTQHIVRARF